MAKVLGIDHGSVRLGIAVSDPSASVAFGREVLKNDKNVLGKLKTFIAEEEIEKVVIGYPLNLKGGKTQQTIEVDKFTEGLKAALSDAPFSAIEVVLWDERFTSKLAADSMLESGMKKKQRQVKGNIDIISAALMLQSYLDSRKNNF
ncbi:MAG: Holliday junction resolvase RuvX [Ignavibacteria bacterium]|nr:Holliday junction resolvase RuvX [Ignavibacteria bacterium]